MLGVLFVRSIHCIYTCHFATGYEATSKLRKLRSAGPTFRWLPQASNCPYQRLAMLCWLFEYSLSLSENITPPCASCRWDGTQRWTGPTMPKRRDQLPRSSCPGARHHRPTHAVWRACPQCRSCPTPWVAPMLSEPPLPPGRCCLLEDLD